MSKKTVYICDGCKGEIKIEKFKRTVGDGVLRYDISQKPYEINNVHICSNCFQILYNLQQAGCEINFLD